MGEVSSRLHTLSLSTLDRILVNERLLNCIVDAGVLHLADNPSRHDPIMMKLDIGTIPVKVAYCKANVRRPAWYKSNDVEIDAYTSSLHSKIMNLNPPECLNCQNEKCQDQKHSEDLDSFVLDTLTAIVEASHQTIPMSGGGNRKTDPDKNCPLGQVIPG